MSKTYNPQLQARLEQYITDVGSQAKAAENIGYSEGTISTYRKGKYQGDVAKLEAKLQELFATSEEAQQLHISTDYAPTSISTGVYDTIRLCHLKGGLPIVISITQGFTSIPKARS